MITPKILRQLKQHLSDNKPLEVTNTKVVFKANNMESIKIFKGTYTIHFLNWGRIKSEYNSGDGYKAELYYRDLYDYFQHKTER